MTKLSPGSRLNQGTAALLQGGSWFVGLTAVLALLDLLLASVPMARAVLGAGILSVAVERLVGRNENAPSMWRGVGLPWVLGAGVWVVSVSISTLLGWCSLSLGQPSMMTVVALGITLVRCVEDELLLRALVFAFALRSRLPLWGVIAFSMLASAAKAGFVLPFQPFHVLLSVALAATACALHASGRDNRKNIAFVFGFAASAGPLSQGGLLEVTWHVVDLRVGGATLSPAAAVFASLAASLVAIGWLRVWGRTTSSVEPTS